ncbi:hypothetical protein RB653_009619 [Dictyostelium firmibasis]|uniref:Peptide-methionine (R)-S-oxide reductase n=1 Tax=Dictyostelium firmibasis TaxID=79012 RepID=A0AAN7U6F1_9MYCE
MKSFLFNLKKTTTNLNYIHRSINNNNRLLLFPINNISSNNNKLGISSSNNICINFNIKNKRFYSNKMNLSEDEWRVKLSPAQFKVLREKGTERPDSGEYNKHYEKGVYNCAACDAPLFKSDHKFSSGCGWPSFYDSIPGALELHEDPSLPGRPRTEICCKNCGSHMGHVFKGERFNTPIDQRHCVNSISLKFHSEK